MFRKRDPQGSLFQPDMLVPPAKARRLEQSWAEVFRNQALPLIDEQSFASMYCADNGRPNRAEQTILGVHILRIIQALGISTSRQRLDSTHILSNIAILPHLGLFCETIRVFIKTLRQEHPELARPIPERLVRRYLKEGDEATHT